MHLKAGVGWGLEVAAHEAHSVGFEHGLKEIGSTYFQHVFDFIVARVVPEALVEKVAFIKLDGTALVAEHELLERHEA